MQFGDNGVYNNTNPNYNRHDPDADNQSQSLLNGGRGPHMDPNLPPGFQPNQYQNPFKMTGMKFSPIGKLGEELMWDEWKLRVDGYILSQPWAVRLFGKECPFLLWHNVKMWLIQWLSKADQQKALRAPNYRAAMDELRRGHAPDDDSTVMVITQKIWSARLAEKETAASLINRILELNATLQSLNSPLVEIHLVAAICRALSVNSHYKQTIDTLKTVGGHLSLRALQMAFNANLSSLIVPGAFYTDADHEDTNASDNYAMLVKRVKNLQNQLKKARFEPKSDGGRASAPSRGGGRQPRGGRSTRGGRGGRTRGVSPGVVKKTSICFNCGGRNHAAAECKKPCGMCGKTGHQSFKCFMNPRSAHYVPIEERNQPRGGRGRARANMVTETTEDYENDGIDYGDEDEDEAEANIAVGSEICHPFQNMHIGEDDDDRTS
jgi:hypothetical protein